MVERRWAMTKVVLPCAARSSACCTSFSLAPSNAEVASSSSRIFAPRTIARAIAILCFCPPLSFAPLSPQGVSYPCGSFEMKRWALASRAAASIISLLTEDPCLPMAMLSKIEEAKSTGSCETKPICFLNHSMFSSEMFTPSSSMLPAVGS
mmetsp:Transcript_19946/g.45453  ORF Transcript_19946/g.45453 Transcript_19946/m.45453 type:complete len:151 (+) Transcript_19946:2312-2764(+)